MQYGDATESALRHEQWLGALRLPGRSEYLAALDEAVTAAVRAEKPPLEALLQADKKWREITRRLGLDASARPIGTVWDWSSLTAGRLVRYFLDVVRFPA